MDASALATVCSRRLAPIWPRRLPSADNVHYVKLNIREALYQSVTRLPFVANGCYSVPGTAHLTTFGGAAVRTMPQVRTYLATDVVPFLSTEKGDFKTVDTTWPPLPVFPPLLLIVGIVVVVYGAAMLFISRRRPAAPTHREPAHQPTPR